MPEELLPGTLERSGDAVDARLKSAQTQKTELETQLLQWQLSPAYQRLEKLKTYFNVSGLVLAFVAIVGGILSILGWYVDRSSERELRTQERLERILAGLSAETVENRVSSISALNYFMVADAPARNTQILTSLANALPLEQSSLARSTILAAFQSLDEAAVGQLSLNTCVATLARNSRVLMKESGLSVGLGTEDIWEKGLSVKHSGALLNIADAIAILLRKGARTTDLSGTYLAKQDFTGLQLNGTSFDASILASTNFSHTKLVEASFAGAHLEGSHFVGADLRKARITGSIKHNYMRPYVTRLTILKGQGAGINSSVEMPDFSCADLRGANFSSHMLFGFIEDAAAKIIDYYHWPVRFGGANLAEADLRELKPFAVARYSERGNITPFAGCCGSTGSEIRGGVHMIFYGSDDNAKLDDSLKKFQVTAQGIVKSFKGSNWKSATLPRWLREYLDKENVSQVYEFEDGIPCHPLAPWSGVSQDTKTQGARPLGER